MANTLPGVLSPVDVLKGDSKVLVLQAIRPGDNGVPLPRENNVGLHEFAWEQVDALLLLMVQSHLIHRRHILFSLIDDLRLDEEVASAEVVPPALLV